MAQDILVTDQFTYVSAFLSIVIALALTHLLAGIAALLRARVVRVSWRYATWVGILMFACVDYWFSIWGLRTETGWSLGFVLYLLVLATLLYISVRLVVPHVSEGVDLDLAAFDNAHRRKYLAAFAAYIATGTIANLSISGFQSAVWINVVTLALIACAWLWPDPRVQTAVTSAILALFGYYAFKYIPAL